ncbi:MAG: secondary thiamine-phosphate synthase enzyme YjbQ [Candidatus Pacearchaeota archaeon]|nr:secondary thiamine-phosphate synthase enzyme YjbQ [Candidatus Pacearchaeota archaeon]
MKCFLKEVNLQTKKEDCFYDITESVKKIVKDAGIKNGHILIQPMHTTVGIFLNENEERLLKDFVNFLCNKAPCGINYLHDDILLRKDNCPLDEPVNGHSHIRATCYSNPSLSLILYDNKIQLGTYQKILLAEFDGPCPRRYKSMRKYLVSVIGDE